MLCIQVMLFLLLASCTSSNVPTTEKTVPQGATVTEPFLNVSSLDKDDQLMTYHQDKLCAEYFCDNGTCNNHPTSESYFQVYSGNLCLIIPNVNSSNNGQYSVILNGNKDVLKLTLHVEEVPQHSILSWLDPVMAVAVFAVLLLVILGLIYKIFFVITRKIELLFELCSILCAQPERQQWQSPPDQTEPVGSEPHPHHNSPRNLKMKRNRYSQQVPPFSSVSKQ